MSTERKPDSTLERNYIMRRIDGLEAAIGEIRAFLIALSVTYECMCGHRKLAQPDVGASRGCPACKGVMVRVRT